MENNFSRWPLFTEDLDFAQKWMRAKLANPNIVRSWRDDAHTAISIGLKKEVLELLSSSFAKSVPSHVNDQLKFRLARMKHDPCLYEKLIPQEIDKSINKTINLCLAKKIPIEIELFGGIGDHLEIISLLLPWAKKNNIKLNLNISAGRKVQLKRVMQPYQFIHLIEGSKGLSMMGVRGWIRSRTNQNYLSWIEIPNIVHNNNYIVCCWKAEGRYDPFSAFCRSIPSQIVQNIINKLNERLPGIKIIDISNWSPWEKNQLAEKGVLFKDPQKTDLYNIGELINQASCIITIDTALAHLCAAMNKEAILLLPKFHDERWHEIHNKNSSYGENLCIIKNQDFGSWKNIVETLTREVIGSLRNLA